MLVDSRCHNHPEVAQPAGQVKEVAELNDADVAVSGHFDNAP